MAAYGPLLHFNLRQLNVNRPFFDVGLEQGRHFRGATVETVSESDVPMNINLSWGIFLPAGHPSPGCRDDQSLVC
jgi:hypothetical protein